MPRDGAIRDSPGDPGTRRPTGTFTLPWWPPCAGLSSSPGVQEAKDVIDAIGAVDALEEVKDELR
jgi:hypothetical protein